jgi:UDP:flavonoid glycosyltransferase YjiC (YdhE family)
MPAAQFFRAIQRGTPIFDFPTLERYVRDDLALLDRVRPDVVVGDFRVSLGISARLAKVPFLNVTDAYWSPWSNVRCAVPDYDWVKLVGPAAGTAIFRVLRGVGFRVHARPVNRARRKFGLAPIDGDFRHVLDDGDYTCYADLPEIIPIDPLPPNHSFIGPVPWSPRGPLPEWWDDAMKERAGTGRVYVSLGSSGARGVLQHVLDALEHFPVKVLVSTAGRDPGLRKTKNCRVADFLPGDSACAAAQLVICNGGSPTTYQALAAGVPVIGIAANMDQFLNMTAVSEAGCGTLVRSSAASTDTLIRAIARGLEDSGLRDKAGFMRQAIERRSATTEFRCALESLLGRKLPARPIDA